MHKTRKRRIRFKLYELASYFNVHPNTMTRISKAYNIWEPDSTIELIIDLYKRRESKGQAKNKTKG
jgi:hypothetical protein